MHKTTDIENIEEYYYIDVEASVDGPPQKMVDLLIDFQKAGLLIKYVKLLKPNNDRNQLKMDVLVSRLAKRTQQEIDKRRRSTKRRRR